MEISKLIAENVYEYFGLRVTDEPLTVGMIAPCSHVWIDGDYTDELLDGASAMDARRDAEKAAKKLTNYSGKYISLLGSDRALHGDDAGELIMRDALVLGCWERANA